jgi:hypothetical protein
VAGTNTQISPKRLEGGKVHPATIFKNNKIFIELLTPPRTPIIIIVIGSLNKDFSYFKSKGRWGLECTKVQI